MDTIMQPKTPAERARAYRQRKKQSEPLTKERRIEILESKISDPNISPRDLKSLSRELSLLKGETMPYDRRPVAERKPPEPPPERKPLPSWLVRCDLVQRVADRLRNASEQVLTAEEIEAGGKADFTPEELLASVKKWTERHKLFKAHPETSQRALYERYPEQYLGTESAKLEQAEWRTQNPEGAKYLDELRRDRACE